MLRAAHYPLSCREQCRRGVIIVMAAFMMVMVFGFLAFSVDTGYLALHKAKMQGAADAAVLAACQELNRSPGNATATEAAEAMIEENYGSGATAHIQFGYWDDTTKQFVESGQDPNAVKVTLSRARGDGTALPLFFAPVINVDDGQLSVSAIGMVQPRDVMLVLDCSSSMNYDSHFRSRQTMGIPAIEVNLRKIFDEFEAQNGPFNVGSMQWVPQYYGSSTYSSIKQQFGMTSANYPFSSGSWNEYINYVRNNSDVYNSGYRYKYGYLTLIAFILSEEEGAYRCAELANVSEEPIKSVKNAMGIFLEHMQPFADFDRVGLVTYTAYGSIDAKLETPMTHTFSDVASIVNTRQAGHYTSLTSIGAGIERARVDFNTNGRGPAEKIVVLMTDGKANVDQSGNYTLSGGKTYALNQADLAKDDRTVIYTISLGSGADIDLMQQIADKTGGVHYNIPGGQSVENYREQLIEVYKEIAESIHAKIVN